VDPDPDPGEQKLLIKVEKKERKKNLCFEGFFCNLDVFYGGLEIGKL
jgi:hypothetical protein